MLSVMSSMLMSWWSNIFREKKKKEIHVSVCESAPGTAKITNGKVAELTNSWNDDYFFFLSTVDSHYEAES